MMGSQRDKGSAVNLWIHATIWNFSKVERSQSPRPFGGKRNLGGRSEEVMVSSLSTTIIKVHSKCPSVQTVFAEGSSERWRHAQQSAAQRQDVLGKHLWNKKLKNNIKAACGLMRNRPDRLNCPGPSSPQFQHTMTGQEIDTVIAYFGGNLGQFVTPWQHAPSPWIALLSIQKALNLTDRNEFCLAILEKKWKGKESSVKCFSSWEFNRTETQTFPPLIQSGKERHGTVR